MRSLMFLFIAIVVVATTIYAQKLRIVDEPAPAAPKKKATTAIYLRHAGDVDKPIVSIIVSELGVPDVEVKDPEKVIDLDTAKRLSIDSDVLSQLISETHSRISKIIENRKSNYEYGTFSVRIVEDSQRAGRVLGKDETSMSRILDKQQTIELIESSIEKISKAMEPTTQQERTKTDRESLRNELTAALHRIKPNEKQE